MIVNRRVLLVGADNIFRLPPQRIHGVQLGGPFRQPQQLDPEQVGQLHRARRGMTGVLVLQQGDRPAPVAAVDQFYERLVIYRPLVLPGQQQPVSGAQVYPPEDDPPGVPAAQQHLLGLSAWRPARPQGREQQQVGLVFSQQGGAGWQGPDLPPQPPFLSPVRGPGPG